MLTQTISPIFGLEEQKSMLLTQSGGSGNGSIIIADPYISNPDDDEPRAAVLEAEAYLLWQRITRLINITTSRNKMKPRIALREQRGHATLAIFGEGGAL